MKLFCTSPALDEAQTQTYAPDLHNPRNHAFISRVDDNTFFAGFPTGLYQPLRGKTVEEAFASIGFEIDQTPLIHGFVIDPATQDVCPAAIITYKDIYPILGIDTFDVVQIDGTNCVFVDDEGLLKPNQYFKIAGYPQPLAGKGFLLATDNSTGETISTKLFYEQVVGMVQWL